MSKHKPRFIQRIGYSNIYTLDKGLIWQSGMDIDADGSPHAYAPPHTKLIVLDYLMNARNERGEFVGVAIDAKGHPFVQGDHDPAPGYYVSTTALQDSSKDRSDPRRYVDSEKIPFCVIPNREWFKVNKCWLGGLGIAFYRKTGAHSFFIIADLGPMHKIGEGSIRLAKELTIDPDAKTGGVAGGVIFMLFAGTHLAPVNATAIQDESAKFFDKWGGLNDLADLTEELFC